MTDWQAWHLAYDDPHSDLSGRRRAVQRRIEAWLDGRPDEDLRVVSACSGDGRDLLEVLARRPDGGRVSALLLELDEGLAASASAFAAEHDLQRVDVRRDDAGVTDSYADAVPADLVMLCGVLGNLADEDARATVAASRELSAPGALVIWTRGRFADGDPHGGVGEPTDRVRSWFAEDGFEEVGYDAPRGTGFRVGAHRLVAEPTPLVTGHTFFTFTR
ncbi:MAG: SAM-dependent methyltransferase [Nocardioidaceae bacterium]